MPPDLDRIRRLAAAGDPFFRGAAWMLDQLNPEAPETPGLSHARTDRKDA